MAVSPVTLRRRGRRSARGPCAPPTGPTKEPVSRRGTPPIANSSTCGSSAARSTCSTGPLLVITRTASPRSAIRRARKYVVDDESRNTVSPGCEQRERRVGQPQLRLRRRRRRACANEFSGAAIDGSTAPPWVRRALPRRSSSSRSRRAVIGETPKRACSSVTVTAPRLHAASTCDLPPRFSERRLSRRDRVHCRCFTGSWSTA